MCQTSVGGDDGIHCWDPSTGQEQAHISGSFPWTTAPQEGLAYRPDDDSFYVGGWGQGVVYHVAGLSSEQPGEVLGSCTPADGRISGLAWNPSYEVLWEATNSPTDSIFAIDPATCMASTTLPFPDPGFNGGGLDMNYAGDLWAVSQAGTVYLLDSGLLAFFDVPWLSETPVTARVRPGAQAAVTVTIDATNLVPGTYGATLVVRSNAGRSPEVLVPVGVTVTATS
jgi:hypothetical protein